MEPRSRNFWLGIIQIEEPDGWKTFKPRNLLVGKYCDVSIILLACSCRKNIRNYKTNMVLLVSIGMLWLIIN